MKRARVTTYAQIPGVAVNFLGFVDSYLLGQIALINNELGTKEVGGAGKVKNQPTLNGT